MVSKPKVAIYVLTGSVKGVAVSKSSAAAISKVSKPNVDCNRMVFRQAYRHEEGYDSEEEPEGARHF